jgi:hypothetical protein
MGRNQNQDQNQNQNQNREERPVWPGGTGGLGELVEPVELVKLVELVEVEVEVEVSCPIPNRTRDTACFLPPVFGWRRQVRPTDQRETRSPGGVRQAARCARDD